MTRQIDLEADIHRLLVEDDRIAEQGVTVHHRENVLVLDGEVESAQRRDEICRRIAAHYPDLEIVCDIGLTRTQAPAEVEEIS